MPEQVSTQGRGFKQFMKAQLSGRIISKDVVMFCRELPSAKSEIVYAFVGPHFDSRLLIASDPNNLTSYGGSEFVTEYAALHKRYWSAFKPSELSELQRMDLSERERLYL